MPLEAFEAGEARRSRSSSSEGSFPEGLHNVKLAPTRIEHGPITPEPLDHAGASCDEEKPEEPAQEAPRECEGASKCRKCGTSYYCLGEDNGLCASCHFEAIKRGEVSL